MPEAAPPDKTFFVTTPIYYVNDAPHIGHAYTTVAGDVLTRWHRQRGEQVWFLTGTDEHGEKVLRSAEAASMAPQEWCDRLVEQAWKPVLHTIDAANDDFIRTTEERHTRRVQAFLQGLYDAGQIYEDLYEGPYCVHCEEFKLPGELLDGEGDYAGQKVCAIHGRPVEQLSERNWFFPLSKYADRLLAHYAEHPEAVEPASARNEVLSFIRSGLQDLSISRSSFDWGIPVPWDPTQVVYVWFDALLNYATAVGLGDTEGAGVQKFATTFPADVHLVGKDILRFHAVIWPAMLMAAGESLPRKVFAHGWLLVGGEKMSKSKLTGIAPADVIDHFGSDAFRYYFLRAIQFGSDGSFSWEDMSRALHVRAGKRVRQPRLAGGRDGRALLRRQAARGWYARDRPRRSSRRPPPRLLAGPTSASLALDFSGGINAIWELVDVLNGYLTEQAPWQLAKSDDDRRRLETVLYTAAEGLRVLAVLLNPVMPKACAALWESLGAQPALGALAAQPSPTRVGGASCRPASR
jgi:methionyl-tRNA synthetase